MPDVLPEDEVVRICQELIRIDTSNYGDGSGPGERAAAEYAAGLIEEVGLSAEIFESAPGRANVVTRLAGEDPSASALVVHGHLDVAWVHVGVEEAIAEHLGEEDFHASPGQSGNIHALGA